MHQLVISRDESFFVSILASDSRRPPGPARTSRQALEPLGEGRRALRSLTFREAESELADHARGRELLRGERRGAGNSAHLWLQLVATSVKQKLRNGNVESMWKRIFMIR